VRSLDELVSEVSGSGGFVREMIKILMVTAAKGSQAILSIREEQILRDPYVSLTPFRLWPECEVMPQRSKQPTVF
jgi:hypothetical protein